MRLPRRSNARIACFSVLVSFLVLGAALASQWLVYSDWLHETGPIRILGSTAASCIAFAFVFYRLREAELKELEAKRQFQTIAEMNDRIRNALQAIELLLWASESPATRQLSEAVDAIDAALKSALNRSSEDRRDAAIGRKAAAASARSQPVDQP